MKQTNKLVKQNYWGVFTVLWPERIVKLFLLTVKHLERTSISVDSKKCKMLSSGDHKLAEIFAKKYRAKGLYVILICHHQGGGVSCRMRECLGRVPPREPSLPALVFVSTCMLSMLGNNGTYLQIAKYLHVKTSLLK